MTSAGELIKVLKAGDKLSARSQQVSIGPSEIGDCSRKVYYKLNGQEPTNPDTLQMAAIMGTAIHGYIENAIKRTDPFGDRYLLEIEAEADGIKGHIDVYDKTNREVIDWKTVKIKNLGFFPSKSQRWQVQIYGHLLKSNGYEVDNVTLVAIPRDGDERDIVFHSEAFDPAVVAEAFAWYENVKSATEAPAPEKDASFCQHYCPFFDESGAKGCTGRTAKDDQDDFLIEDESIANAAQAYIELGITIRDLEKKQDAAKASLEGINGKTANGIKIKWSSVAGRSSVDEAAVKEALGYVPTKQGKGYEKITVKK